MRTRMVKLIAAALAVVIACACGAREAAAQCAAWSETPLPPGPSPRLAAGQVAFDPVSQRTLLFAGTDERGVVSSSPMWSWNGTAWSQTSPINFVVPDGHEFGVFTYDGRGMLYFGGQDDQFSYGTTYRWDGDEWIRLFPGGAPAARSSPAYAYDGARDRVVMFGGWNGSARVNETYEWDGVNWGLRSIAGPLPTARSFAAMAYDSARNRIVLFGGFSDAGTLLNDTWEYDGTSWMMRSPVTVPPARNGHVMAYDAARGVVVMTGGSATSVFGDTYTWNGVDWTLVNTPGPRAQSLSGVAYDSFRSRTVVFGGWFGYSNELWEWDGSAWTAAAAPMPVGRSAPGFSFDRVRGVGVLFGGLAPGGIRFGDTWEYEGGQWRFKSDGVGPSPRRGHGMVYDRQRGLTILMGGNPAGTASVNDVWSWDGSSWSAQPTGPSARVDHAMAWIDSGGVPGASNLIAVYGGRVATSAGAALLDDLHVFSPTTGVWTNVPNLGTPPGARRGHAMAFDEARRQLVLFGGIHPDGTSFLGDTYVWSPDTGAWGRLLPLNAPAARQGHIMVYDEARQRVVLHGGATGTTTTTIQRDTWEWDGSNWIRLTDADFGRFTGSAAFDPVGDRVLVYGGLEEDSGYAARLSVYDASAPQITTQPPASRLIALGTSGSISVVATSESAVTYQWRRDGIPVVNGNGISGVTTGTIVFNPAALAHEGVYACAITNDCGTTISEPSTLDVCLAPEVTDFGNSDTYCAGAGGFNVSLSAQNGTLTYQWRRNGVNLTNGNGISGATSPVLNVSAVTLAVAGNYDCIVTNECSSVISPTAVITVLEMPTVAPQTPIVRVCSGSNVELSVSATGGGLSYQWFKGPMLIAGATSATLSIPGATPADSGSYFCGVSNACGSVGSSGTVVDVRTAPDVALTGPTMPIPVGGGATLSSQTTGVAPFVYQWFRSPSLSQPVPLTPIPGATGPTLSLSNLTLSDEASYVLSVTDSCGTSQSPGYVLDVCVVPTITQQPASLSVCAGARAQFSVAASDAVSYQWSKNGTEIVGATGAMYVIASTIVDDSGMYTCRVSNACGSVESMVATLAVGSVPVFSDQPDPVITCFGSDAVFTAAATGGEVSYQWQVNAGQDRWQGFADGLPGEGVYASTELDPDGEGPQPAVLYVGGSFTGPGGGQPTNIARWDGAAWQPVGTGLNARVRALTAWDSDGEGPLAPQLVAAGEFTDAGGNTAADRIARWNGSAWLPLASGLGAQVNALATWDHDANPATADRLVAGGVFLNAGGNGNADRIAFWDGAAWQPLAAGVAADVFAIVALDSDGAPATAKDLFIAGAFVDVGGNASADRVVRWNGSNWVNLGTGLNNAGRALAAHDPDGSGPATPVLIVGGDFSGAGGVVAARIAVWSPAAGAWAALGGGVASRVNSVSSWDRDGAGPNGPDIVAVGEFVTASGNPASRVALWNGASSSWSFLGSNVIGGGVNGSALSVSTWNPDVLNVQAPQLVVGGDFTSADTIAADSIARWTSGFQDVPGATGAVFSILGVDAEDIGTYRCLATNTCGATPSSEATLSIGDAPLITAQPQPDSAPLGGSASFTVVASGSSLAYQWRKGMTDLVNGPGVSGATSATLTLSNITAESVGTYTCVVTRVCSTVSAGAALTLCDPPTVTQQPTGASVCTGGSSSFTIAASSTSGGLTYQWRRNSVNLVNNATFAGVTTPTLTISNAQSGNAGQYDCVVTDSCAAVTSAVVTLTVNAAPAITGHPNNATQCSGGNASFSVSATGGSLEYQWQRNGVDITLAENATARSSTLNLPGVTPAIEGNYRCRVMNPCGSANSNSAALIVRTAPILVSSPQARTAPLGGSTQFSVTVTAFGPPAYQWRRNGVNLVNGPGIAGATSATLTLSNLSLGSAGDYDCRVTDTCGGITTPLAALMICTPPSFTQQPAALTVCAGAPAQFTAVATGDAPILYQWRRNGVNLSNGGGISGADSPVLVIANAQSGNAGTYTCVVSNGCGTPATSAGGVLSVNSIPAISTQPLSRTACAGGSTTLTVAATGGDLAYQWQRLGTGSGNWQALGNAGASLGVYAATTWDHDANPATPDHVVIGGEFASVGGQPNSIVHVWNGSSWQGIGNFPQSAAWALTTWDHDANPATPSRVVMGLDHPSPGPQRVLAWNGAAWESIGSITNGQVRALCSWDHDANPTTRPMLVAGGSFVDAGSNTRSDRIAAWDGVSWLNMANGLPGTVFTIGAWDVDANPSTAPRVVAGGFYENVGGLPSADFITTFDGFVAGTWSPFGSGLNQAVRHVALWDHDGLPATPPSVVASGDFVDAGGQSSADYVARADPNFWQPLAAGISNSVFVGAPWDHDANPATADRLVIGGVFSDAGMNASADRIAFLNGASWGAFASGLSGNVYTVIAWDHDANDATPDRLIATGLFTDAGGIDVADRVAIWTEQSGFQDVPGATSASLVVSNLSAENAGDYRCVITNTCGQAISNVAAINLSTQPTIAQQPSSISRPLGASAAFQVNATGVGTLTYQWRRGGINLSNTPNITGVNTSTLTILSITANDAGDYDCIVTDSCGSVTSAAAALALCDLPVIVEVPLVNITICTDSTAATQLSVIATGGPLTYQWRAAGTPIPGATSSTYIASFNAPGVFTFDCVVTNACGSITTQTITASVTIQPTITAQPVPATQCAGGSASFSVGASGGNLSYQWQRNGVGIALAQNPTARSQTLVINPVTLADDAVYRCIVSNGCNDPATSNNASLTVRTGPTFAGNPQSLTRPVGGSATLSVSVSSFGSPSYQWRRNNINLSNGPGVAGATTATLSLTNLTIDSQGSYDCIVTDSCGSATSLAGVLTVCSPPSIDVQPMPVTLCAGSNTTFQVSASGEGPLTYQWRRNGSNIADGGVFTGTNTPTLTINGVQTANAGTYTCVVTNACAASTSAGALLTVNSIPSITVQPVSRSVCTGASFILGVAASGNDLAYQWFIGQTAIPGATNPTQTFVFDSPTLPQQVTCQVTNLCGSTTSNPATITVFERPIISMQPVSLVRPAGASASFSVAASGVGTFQYIWRRNGVNLVNGAGISGATSTTLTISSINDGNAGDYDCQITDTCGNTLSAIASLTICPAPTIVSQPAPLAACNGGSAQFSVAAVGDGLTYQWRRNGVNLSNNATYSGVNTPLLTISPVSAGIVGSFSCLVTDICTSTTSAAAALSLLSTPTFTSSPPAATLCVGGPLNLSAAAAGGSLTYQWTLDGVEIPGATSSTFMLPSVALDDAGVYRCVATNPCGSATTTGTTITVTPGSQFTLQPTSQVAQVGGGASFSVAADGPGITYQWLRADNTPLANGSGVSGATTPTLSFSNVPASLAGAYRCRLTDACGVNDSSLAVLSVVGPDLSIAPGSVVAPASAAFNQTFTVEWTESNIGDRAAFTPWTNRVIFSFDQTLGNSDDVVLQSATSISTLEAGAERAISYNVSVPLRADSVAGSYCLFIREDALSEVAELSEANNATLCIPISLSIPPLPDLLVEGVTAPPTALTGRSIEVSWMVRNGGPGSAPAPWNDRVLISTSPTGSGATSLGVIGAPRSLASGDSYTRSGVFAVPSVPGTYYLVVEADARDSQGRDSVIEMQGEFNNQGVSVQPLVVSEAPRADLVVEDLIFSVPSEGVVSGSPFAARFNVRNIGEIATEVTSWRDSVFISTEPNITFDGLNGSAAIFCTVTGASIPNPQYLPVNEAYQSEVEFTLPRDVQGDYYVYVLTDRACNVSPRVPDSNRTNNIRRSAGTFRITLEPQPDLAPSNIRRPMEAFSGAPITITWDTCNQGVGLTDTGSWNEQVYLSRDNNPSITVGDFALCPSVPRNGLRLNPGECHLERSCTAPTPVTFAGQYFVKVIVDSANQITEFGFESNNIAVSSPLTILPSPRPDILPIFVEGPDGVVVSPGCFIEVSWGATNEGAPSDISASWTDAVFLSTDTVLSADDRRLGGDGMSISPGNFPNYQRTRTYRVPSATPPGMYHIIVQCDETNTLFEGTCPDHCEFDNVLASTTRFTISLPPPVDLVPLAITAPDGVSVFRGGSAQVGWSVGNIGSTPIAAVSWSDGVSLSADAVLDPSDLLLSTAGASAQACDFASYARNLSFTVPTSVPPGDYRLIVTLDRTNTLPEGTCETACEQNNTIVSAGVLRVEPGAADLLVSVDPASPAGGPIGSGFNLTWQVTNIGDAPTQTSSWRDRIVLISETSGAVVHTFTTRLRSGALGVGASYTSTVGLSVPITLAPGAYRLGVITDVDNDVFEPANESNNSTSTPFTITGEIPDLVASMVSVPDSVVAGQPFTVQWTISNQGTLTTLSSQWQDAVFLSIDSVVGNADDIALTPTRTRNGSLAPGASYVAAATFTRPITSFGTFFVYVRSDAGLSVLESNEGNNVAFAPTTMVIIPADPSNLVVSEVTSPVMGVAGQPISGFSYRVTNVGVGATNASSWRDAIYLSRDEFIDTSNDVFLGEFTRQGVLEAGAGYTGALPAGAALPLNASGEYYLIVRTDSSAAVFEGPDEGDNTLSAANPIVVVQPLPADLVVESISPPPAGGRLGFPASFTWSIRNEGEVSVIGQWQDTLYLSSDDVFDLGDAPIGRFVNASGSTSIAPGESRSFTHSATIPGVVPGDYFVFVRTDVFNNIPETDEANNLAVSLSAIPITIQTINLGETFSDASASQGARRYYQFNAPDLETIRITLAGLANDATELFVKSGAIPTPGNFDVAYTNPDAAIQRVSIPTSVGGPYFIQARKSLGASPGLMVTPEIVPFGVASLAPAEIGAGVVTVTAEGSRWRPGTVFRLKHRTSEAMFEPVNIRDQNGVRARLTFDLTGAPPGAYDLEVISDALRATAILPDAAMVDPVTSPFVIAEYNPGPNIRRRRAEPRVIALRNAGNVDASHVLLDIRTWNIPGVGITVTDVADSGLVPQGDTQSFQLLVRDLAPNEIVLVPVDVFIENGYNQPVYALTASATGYTLDDFIEQALIPEADRIRLRLIEQLSSDPSLSPEALAAGLDYLADEEFWRTLYLEGYFQQESLERAPSEGWCIAKCVAQTAVLGTGCVALAAIPPPALGASLSLACLAGVQVLHLECIACCTNPCGGICQTPPPSCNVPPPPAACPAPPPPPRCPAPSGSDDIIEVARPAPVTILSMRRAPTSPSIVLRSRGLNDNPTNPPPPPPPMCNASGGSGSCNPSGQSVDPNEMRGPGGYGEDRWIAARRPLTYRVLFENLPTASAPAQTVSVVVPIDAELRPGSFRVRDINIAGETYEVAGNSPFFQTRIDLRETVGVFVDVIAGVNLLTTPAEAFWTFRSIDPDTGELPLDALVGFLPPEDGMGIGQGYVDFTIEPRTNTATRAELAAYADIVFDSNETITTNTVSNTLDATLPSSRIDPVPSLIAGVEVPLTVTVTDPQGPGVDRVRIFASVDGGQFISLGEFAPLEEITFIGEPARVYRLYSVAIDFSGNEELPPSNPIANPDVLFTTAGAALELASDSGTPGDALTNNRTPSFLVVAAPSTVLDVMITGPETRSGSVPIGPDGRGAFAVPSNEPLPDGDYTFTASLDDVSFSTTFTIDGASPQPNVRLSIVDHAGVGPAALLVPEDGSFVEPRAAGLSTLRLLFPESERGRLTLAPGGVAVEGFTFNNTPVNTSGIMMNAALINTPEAPAVDIRFVPALPDGAVYCISLSTLGDTAGNAAAANDLRVGVSTLAGDVTGDRRVNNTDVGAARGRRTDPIDPLSESHLRADVNADGAVSELDDVLILAARGRDLRQVVEPCPRRRIDEPATPVDDQVDVEAPVLAERAGAGVATAEPSSSSDVPMAEALALDASAPHDPAPALDHAKFGAASADASDGRMRLAIHANPAEPFLAEATIREALARVGVRDAALRALDGAHAWLLDVSASPAQAEDFVRDIEARGVLTSCIVRDDRGREAVHAPWIEVTLAPGAHGLTPLPPDRGGNPSIVSNPSGETDRVLLTFEDRSFSALAHEMDRYIRAPDVSRVSVNMVPLSIMQDASAPSAFADLVSWLAALGDRPTDRSDLNADGLVDQNDLRLLLENIRPAP